MQNLPFYEQPIRGSICFVRANRSNALNTWRTAALCRIVICTSENTTWRTARPVLYNFHGVCRNYADFLCMIPILRRFGIMRCNRQAALHSALFNYTPLVIRGTDKNKQLTIAKPMQTGINRNKYAFFIIKSSEPINNSKTSRVS